MNTSRLAAGLRRIQAGWPWLLSMAVTVAMSMTMVTLPAAAQTSEVPVWRCGADGRSFSDLPCADGRQVALQIDRPDASRLQQAQALAAREARTAALLQRARAEREDALAQDGPRLASLSLPRTADAQRHQHSRPHASKRQGSSHHAGTSAPSKARGFRLTRQARSPEAMAMLPAPAAAPGTSAAGSRATR